MNTQFRGIFLCLATLVATAAFADEGAGKPIATVPGKLLFEDDFSRSEMAPKWSIGKGFFTIHDGVVTAAENPEDHHGAYAYVKPGFPYKDIIAEFSFKFDDNPRVICNLMMEDKTYKGAHAGHIIRASIYSGQVELVDMKTGNMKIEYFEKMKDPKTTPDEKKAMRESIKEKTAIRKFSLDRSKWHQARVEVIGDEMLLSIDGKLAGYLKSEGVGHPTKNMIGFTVNNKTCLLDNLKVWEATASPDWAARRAEVIGALPK
jgi:hypothetical protein